MSGYVEQNADGIEPVSDSWGEIASNQALYNVISGCALTYDAANMTVDLAAGAIMHFGSPIQIAAASNAFTVVSDPSNPRWTWLCLDSTGTAVVVSGDPAVTPSVPELGDRVALALLKVEAAQTVAANIATKLDKRIPNPQGLIAYVSTAATTTSTSATDLIVISKLGFDDSIPVKVPLRITGQFSKDASAAQAVWGGLTINATAVIVAQNGTVNLFGSSATQQAEDGYFDCYISPREASYLTGFHNRYATKVSASGAAGLAAVETTGLSAPFPNAAITSITIRGFNETASNNLAVKNIFVYAG